MHSQIQMAEEKKAVSLPYLAVLLVLWYALNVQYNLYNKKILNAFPYPYTVSLIQVKRFAMPAPVLGTNSENQIFF